MLHNEEVEMKRTRSKRAPSIPLDKAIERVGSVLEAVGGSLRTALPQEGVAAAWNASSTGGGFLATLSTVVEFGLLERERSGGQAWFRVTKRAHALLRSTDEAEKAQHLQAAALEPMAFSLLWHHIGGVLPPEDGVLAYYLESEHDFAAAKAKKTARMFRATMELANPPLPGQEETALEAQAEAEPAHVAAAPAAPKADETLLRASLSDGRIEIAFRSLVSGDMAKIDAIVKSIRTFVTDPPSSPSDHHMEDYLPEVVHGNEAA